MNTGTPPLSPEATQQDPAVESSAINEACGPLYTSAANNKGLKNIGYLIRLNFHSISQMIEAEMEPLGLTSSQWHPIAIIGLNKANTPASVARTAEVDTGAMTRTLDRLEKKGFLKRRRSTNDRRVVELELTEKGHTVTEKLMPAVSRALNAHLKGFTDEEATLLISFLQRMQQNGNTETYERLLKELENDEGCVLSCNKNPSAT
ncbi:MarR family winged helix-turn-helix transcriptional regulator [Advenella mimigardefordensis]|uniref:Transcriptional regulator, MarR family n=1 Tax=Advenella mimigardefordensis (strain DSM 17166 / LMG 22922 / DPN7) TaxID=1247726 RepID=W0PHH6_ADVMD|nr:MarR family transcriptional regulator [Advenella mimigardefordensis]AHG64403.1 transcriptional regulator, MarR family [Advenella mimigardefordensis DPN7]